MSKITIRHFNAPHPATQMRLEKPVTKKLYAVAVNLGIVDFGDPYAVGAYVDGVLVGVFKFAVRRGTLYADGTIVVKKFRKLGVATKLWAAAIKKYKPKKIDVAYVSRGGKRLVNRLTELYPKIEFELWDLI